MRPDLRRAHPEAPPEVKAGSRDRHGRKFSSIRGQWPAPPGEDQRVPLCVCVCVCVLGGGGGEQGIRRSDSGFPLLKYRQSLNELVGLEGSRNLQEAVLAVWGQKRC